MSVMSAIVLRSCFCSNALLSILVFGEFEATVSPWAVMQQFAPCPKSAWPCQALSGHDGTGGFSWIFDIPDLFLAKIDDTGEEIQRERERERVCKAPRE